MFSTSWQKCATMMSSLIAHCRLLVLSTNRNHLRRHHPQFCIFPSFRRHLPFGPRSLSTLLLINLLLFTAQLSTVYSWSVSNYIILGNQASIQNADTVAIGAQKGLNECARQFTYERWPCPESIFSKNIFRNTLPLNREIAFVQAIISAGIVHTVTRSCNSGAGGSSSGASSSSSASSIEAGDGCKCSSLTAANSEAAATRGAFRWGGCSDDVETASRTAMHYLEGQENGHDLKAMIRRHNNEAGRNAIKETMLRMCKCHGISGACSTQTCWLRINDFKEVGNYLKKAYRRAAKIESAENELQSSGKSLSVIQKWKLIYLQESPDYCHPTGNGSSNILQAMGITGGGGTLGRTCSMAKGKDVSSEERNSCRRLCKKCGHAVRRKKRIVKSSCNCKFQFCCEVKCQQCTTEEITYVCVKSKNAAR